MARGRFYQYGVEQGERASHETDWRPGEMERAYRLERLGEIAWEILANWQQTAGTIYYQRATDRQLEQFEEGFLVGFERGVRKQLGKAYRPHPMTGHYGPEGVGR